MHFKFSPMFGSKIKGFPYPRSSKNSVFSQKINLLQIAPRVSLKGVYSQHTYSNYFRAFYSLLADKATFQVFTHFHIIGQFLLHYWLILRYRSIISLLVVTKGLSSKKSVFSQKINGLQIAPRVPL